jgi:hypothetical protein
MIVLLQAKIRHILCLGQSKIGATADYGASKPANFLLCLDISLPGSHRRDMKNHQLVISGQSPAGLDPVSVVWATE